MEKIINKLIDYHIKGVDIYTHGGSTWLIFTKTKQWVIELTDSKTLWYNYNFFSTIFSYVSLEVVQDQHLITKWVEDNVINKVEDTLENGVKETKMSPTYTEYGDWLDGDERLDNIIQNGIKETQFNSYENKSWVEGVIKGGMKETLNTEYMPQVRVEDTIQNGVKQTLPEVGRYINDVEEVIQDGVKKTHFDSRENKSWIEGVIKKGVKETKQKKKAHLILDTNGRELILESHLVIRDGVKETSHRRYLKTYNIDDTIQDGTEHDYWVMDGHDTPVDKVLDNGVKEIKNPTG